MTATRTPTTNHLAAEGLRKHAQTAAGGRDPIRDWPINDAAQRAAAFAAMASAEQLADISARLLGINITLGEIANAARDKTERQASAVDHTETELQVVRGEIARTDSKASILLAGVALIAGPLASRASTLLHAPRPVAACGLAAALLLALAALLLLNVVLPRLHGVGNGNFIHYARCTPEELRTALGEHADRHGELQALSRIAHAKYRRLARAGLLLKASAVLAVATLAAAAL